MNAEKVERKFKDLNATEKIIKSWNLEKPKLPTPHQIVNEIVNTIISVSKKDDDKSEPVPDKKEEKEG